MSAQAKECLPLAGRVAIVTGAGGEVEGIGIGRACAIVLARRGATVVVADRDARLAGLTARMIVQEGGRAMAVPCDVSQEDDCARLAGQVWAEHGAVDILINNVGIGGLPGTAAEVDVQGWRTGMDVNVLSAALMAKHCIAHMVAGGGGGIVNMSSTAGIAGGHGSLLYPTSKAALVGMTKAMAFHHGPQGIRVNCICPGMVFSPLAERSPAWSAERRELRTAQSLLRTEGTAWDVAYGAAYLCSDDARWVTGIVLPIDGGLSAYANLS